MEVILFAVAYVIIGFASAFYFRWVGDWFLDDFDGNTAAMVVVMWPVFWVFYILKVLISPFVWICEMIFD